LIKLLTNEQQIMTVSTSYVIGLSSCVFAEVSVVRMQPAGTGSGRFGPGDKSRSFGISRPDSSFFVIGSRWCLSAQIAFKIDGAWMIFKFGAQMAVRQLFTLAASLNFVGF
jgi:hypothetical protein